MGPFKLGESVRIPLSVTMDGVSLPVENPRIDRLIAPNGNDINGFPAPMIQASLGIYYYEHKLTQIGNYTAILRCELNGSTLETIETFNVQQPFGFPRIQKA